MYQRLAISLEIPLNDIKGIAAEKIHYVLRARECLSISYNAREGARENRIWFIANDLENWRNTIISQAALLKVDLGVIERISSQLDSDSHDILWYLWENRHAKIDQLAELIDAPNHMHVLLKIRETINPIAEKVVGCPVLLFERSKTDPETGEPVLFSWWLAGQPEKQTPTEDRLLDIFDEGPHIQVIMEVRGVEEPDLALEVEGDAITIRSQNTGASFKETIRLPAEVNSHNFQMHLRNNLLEIKLSKIKWPVVSDQPPARMGLRPGGWSET